MEDTDVMAIVRAVANYLRVNPCACDTADGIGRWWIESLHATPDALSRALDWMKASGLVEELEAADGRLRYRRSASEMQLMAAVEGLCRPQTRH